MFPAVHPNAQSECLHLGHACGSRPPAMFANTWSALAPSLNVYPQMSQLINSCNRNSAGQVLLSANMRCPYLAAFKFVYAPHFLRSFVWYSGRWCFLIVTHNLTHRLWPTNGQFRIKCDQLCEIPMESLLVPLIMQSFCAKPRFPFITVFCNFLNRHLDSQLEWGMWVLNSHEKCADWNFFVDCSWSRKNY